MAPLKLWLQLHPPGPSAKRVTLHPIESCAHPTYGEAGRAGCVWRLRDAGPR